MVVSQTQCLSDMQCGVMCQTMGLHALAGGRVRWTVFFSLRWMCRGRWGTTRTALAGRPTSPLGKSATGRSDLTHPREVGTHPSPNHRRRGPADIPHPRTRPGYHQESPGYTKKWDAPQDIAGGIAGRGVLGRREGGRGRGQRATRSAQGVGWMLWNSVERCPTPSITAKKWDAPQVTPRNGTLRKVPVTPRTGTLDYDPPTPGRSIPCQDDFFHF